MKPAALRRFRGASQLSRRERGITMVLVALAMVAIIAMAALSIDIITLYLAREEAQRSADAAALAAARVISMSGITGDPNNGTGSWQQVCGGSTSPATQAAQAVAKQNVIGGGAGSATVTYSAGSGSSSGSNTDCSTLAGTSAPFGVNPMVTVQIQQTGLPTFFSRIWGRSGNTVSATATAEAFNPSNSGNVGSNMTPVQPRCVKPWVVPNLDPLNPGQGPGPHGAYCQPGGGPGGCHPFVRTADGSIVNPGVSLNGNGVIGETFWLVVDCHHSGSSCTLRAQPQPNYSQASPFVEQPPNLLYVPGQVGTPVAAIPSCAQGNPYEEAIGGCDAPTNYQCGVQSANVVDLTSNPGGSGATTNGVQCLTHQLDAGSSSGQDSLNTNSYPFQILTGTRSLLGTTAGTPITSSTSIVSLPIYDNTAATIVPGRTSVTFVGFLQVFINQVDQWGNVNVTVLNVAGCGNGSPAPNNPVTGSSPVPIRLITPP